LGSANRTNMAWIRTVAGGSSNYVLAYGVANNRRFWSMIVEDNLLAVRLSGGAILFTAPNINDDKWHFITVVVEDTNINTIRGFMDGVELSVSGTPTDNTIDSNAGTWQLGANGQVGGIGGFNGKIDEILIFNKSMELDEINTYFKAGLSQHAVTNVTPTYRSANSYNVSDEGLVAFWAFNNNSLIGENSTHVVDLADTSNATASGNPQWSEENGTVGGAFNLDGTNDFFNVTQTGSLNFGTGDFSAFMWIRPNPVGSSFREMLSNRVNGAGGGQPGYVFDISDQTCNDCLRLVFDDGSGGAVSGSPINFNLDDGLWHFVGFSADRSGDVTIYLDLQTGTFDISGETNNIDSPLTLNIGRENRGNFFDGNIDEIRIYNRTLSTKEVNDLYNKNPKLKIFL